jgi:hypothetical protein
MKKPVDHVAEFGLSVKSNLLGIYRQHTDYIYIYIYIEREREREKERER